MSRIPNFLVILLFSIVSTSASLSAQPAASTNVPATQLGDRAVEAIRGLRLGATVRVMTARVSSEGKLSEIRGDSIWLSSTGSRIGLSIHHVDSAWTRERQTTFGGTVGAVAGGVLLGGYLGMLVSALCDRPNCSARDAIGPAMLGGLVGAVGGTLIGSGAGFLVKRWKRQVP